MRHEKKPSSSHSSTENCYWMAHIANKLPARTAICCCFMLCLTANALISSQHATSPFLHDSTEKHTCTLLEPPTHSDCIHICQNALLQYDHDCNKWRQSNSIDCHSKLQNLMFAQIDRQKLVHNTFVIASTFAPSQIWPQATPIKLPIPAGGVWNPSNIRFLGPTVKTSLPPKWHINQFSRVCTAHVCAKHTHTQTMLHATCLCTAYGQRGPIKK